MGLPLTQDRVRILFWILPVLRNGSLIIQERSGGDLPHAQDPEICEDFACASAPGLMFLTSLKRADVLCSRGSSGWFCSLTRAVWSRFILTNTICWDGTGG